MTTFAKAMGSTQSDFKIILGDLVPFGLEEFYKHIHGIINKTLSKSAFYHAKNYFSILSKLQGISYNLKESQASEKADIDELGSKYLPHSVEALLPLTQYAFGEAYGAKNNYSGLLPEAISAYDKGEDIGLHTYYICTICGNTGRLDNELEHCPICGAPLDKIIKM